MILQTTIICTVKNGESTIVATIKSVLNQTLSNWEFIIVDDGSIDRTYEIINELTKYDNRIKVIKTKGIGRGKALNLALKISKGKYIANIDADDLMHPKKLEIQLNLLKKLPQLFSISTLFNIVYEDDNVKWETIDDHDLVIEDVSKMNFKKNQIDHSSILIRRDCLYDVGGYDENRKSQFDYELWLRAAYKGYSLGRLNRRLVAKRIHKNQSFEKRRLIHLLRSVLLQTTYIIKSNFFYMLVYPIGRLTIGLFPFKVRRIIGSFLKV